MNSGSTDSKIGLSVGIVGLPNVGKSSLFNLLTDVGIAAENYPFTTIEPNIGIVEVHDDRLKVLEEIAEPQQTIPAVIKFVDIAGLVEGASKGEGLGNKFLANIREVDAILHVIRFFVDDNVIHVNEKVDPGQDQEIIEIELRLKDLEVVENRIRGLQKSIRTAKDNDPEMIEFRALETSVKLLEDGTSLRKKDWTPEEHKSLRGLGLLTIKPIVYLFNSNDLGLDIGEMKSAAGIDLDEIALKIDVKSEAEINEMDEEDRLMFMEELGIEDSAINQLTKVCYEVLGLQSFFTAGEKEVRAWTIRAGSTAPQAAGRIHTDFEQKFIAAEVVGFADFSENKGWLGSKEAGKLRLEGKDYIVKDGDVMVFRHGA